jgi:hypothetical protein
MDKKIGYVPTSAKTTISPYIRYWNQSSTLFINGFEINSSIQIYDVSGRNIVDEMAENEYHVQLNKGIYIIRITETQNKESIFKYVMP